MVGIRPASRKDVALSAPARVSKLLWFVFFVGLGLPACADAASAPLVPARFKEGIGPLAKERCDGCHERMPGGAMSVYRNARARVTPGDPGASPYYTVPMGGGHPVSWGDSASAVHAWIEAGAPE
ncbi:hypothetical protein [Polyangium mundeleinium]|uniref:Cytochrome c domain-containing protein n=1 Tax=Polyangium mundeleinium TaxID=2995306 RepID=A0ABT5F1R8_9BACT|nr:hypothetical protein [Polyangium mundeleinium]MDC0747549.1 hypothetical protein [Polyangium mundeleinium]